MRTASTSATDVKSCSTTDRNCKDACSGYGSQTICPPLIVLAVIAELHGTCAASIAAKRV
jgi:predicted metal-binding protein